MEHSRKLTQLLEARAYLTEAIAEMSEVSEFTDVHRDNSEMAMFNAQNALPWDSALIDEYLADAVTAEGRSQFARCRAWQHRAARLLDAEITRTAASR